MNHTHLLNTERWRRFSRYIYERDEGRCVVCGGLGCEAHHWVYDLGFFNPKAVSMLCRRCHLVRQGHDPDHLPESHPLRPDLFRIAHLARCLGEGEGFRISMVEVCR